MTLHRDVPIAWTRVLWKRLTINLNVFTIFLLTKRMIWMGFRRDPTHKSENYSSKSSIYLLDIAVYPNPKTLLFRVSWILNQNFKIKAKILRLYKRPSRNDKIDWYVSDNSRTLWKTISKIFVVLWCRRGEKEQRSKNREDFCF